jgi:hypothetical protein
MTPQLLALIAGLVFVPSLIAILVNFYLMSRKMLDFEISSSSFSGHAVAHIGFGVLLSASGIALLASLVWFVIVASQRV